jgi:hypothetical protein
VPLVGLERPKPRIRSAGCVGGADRKEVLRAGIAQRRTRDPSRGEARTRRGVGDVVSGCVAADDEVHSSRRVRPELEDGGRRPDGRRDGLLDALLSISTFAAVDVVVTSACSMHCNAQPPGAASVGSPAADAAPVSAEDRTSPSVTTALVMLRLRNFVPPFACRPRTGRSGR